MEVKEREPKNLGVLMIGFSPVVREGLQVILTKDEGIEVIGDVLRLAAIIAAQAGIAGNPIAAIVEAPSEPKIAA